MAIAWVLRGGRVTSALIGASRPEQVEDCVGALDEPAISAEPSSPRSTRYAREADINLWAASAERTRRPESARKTEYAGADDMIRNPDPAGLQSRSVDLPRRRRLLHRHLDLRMVSRRPDPPFARPGELAPGQAAARPRQPARHARQSRFRRRLGAVPVLCRRPVLAGLHRRQASRRQLQGRAQLHRHRAGDRRPVVRSRSMSIRRGFDPSLFHDDDGRKWFLNMLWNHVSERRRRQPEAPVLRRHPAAGIRRQGRQAGRPGRRTSSPAAALGLVEGPHLFKRNGWYYLTTAEGGTGYDHAVTMARSRTIDGPYELHPDIHLITSKDAPEAPLQRAGHGQIVETPDGEVYHTHLCSRPLPGLTALAARPRDRDPEMRLGRRRLAAARRTAARCRRSTCPRRQRPIEPAPQPAELRVRFRRAQSCRSISSGCARPIPSGSSRSPSGPAACASSAANRIGSWFDQALVARRQEHLAFRAETELRFSPAHLPAGGRPDPLLQPAQVPFPRPSPTTRTVGRVLTILSCPGDWPDGRLTFPLAAAASPLPATGPVRSGGSRSTARRLQFFYATRAKAGIWSDQFLTPA